jgi:carboxyl-terminal processing protease
MARQIWRMDGYYQVNNLYDRVVQRALEELKKN